MPPMSAERPAPPPDLLQVLREGRDFVLATHRGPDGDALGGALALMLALHAQGKQAHLVAPTMPGDHYRWMPGCEQLVTELAAPPEVAVVIDCDSPSRLGDLQDGILAARVLVQVDHHSGPPCGHIQYVDPAASASSCLVWRLLEALQWPVTPEIATCLYVGIATDTGFFRFENTNAEALGICASLVELGAEPYRIAELVHDSRPLRRLQLTGRALMSLESAADGRIVWGVLTPEDYAATGCNAADTETIIDLFKQAEHQEVCVLFKTPRDAGKWQVSLRSRTLDVAAVARQYGGGGHARAAGFDYEGDLAEVRSSLLKALTSALEQAEAG